MVEVDEHDHYYRSSVCNKPSGRHSTLCITQLDVNALEKAGWQVTPAPQPECATCGDTGSFEVDGHDYPCLSCGRGEGVTPETRGKYEGALAGIRLHHKTYQSIRSSGSLYCDLCAARWPCKTFRMANDALGCNHSLGSVENRGDGPRSICVHCDKAFG